MAEVDGLVGDERQLDARRYRIHRPGHRVYFVRSDKNQIFRLDVWRRWGILTRGY